MPQEAARRVDLLLAAAELSDEGGSSFGSVRLAVRLGLMEPFSAPNEWTQPQDMHLQTEITLEHLVAEGLLAHEPLGPGGVRYHLTDQGRKAIGSLRGLLHAHPVGHRSRPSSLAA